jgi:Smr domain
MQLANSAAARNIFEHYNAKKKLKIIDLHELSIPKAIDQLEERIQCVKKNGIQYLTVVVGMGKHSKSGKAKMKSEVERFAKENNIDHVLDSPFRGCIRFEFKEIYSTCKDVLTAAKQEEENVLTALEDYPAIDSDSKSESDDSSSDLTTRPQATGSKSQRNWIVLFVMVFAILLSIVLKSL